MRGPASLHTSSVDSCGHSTQPEGVAKRGTWRSQGTNHRCAHSCVFANGRQVVFGAITQKGSVQSGGREAGAKVVTASEREELCPTPRMTQERGIENRLTTEMVLQTADAAHNNSSETAPLLETSPLQAPDTTWKILAEIVAISLPALGTLLADPLTSLVDTACVGQFSAIDLAALGPNAAVFNMAFSIVSFVAVALANRIAGNSLKAPDLGQQEVAQRRQENEVTLCHTLIMATMFGGALMGLLFVSGRTVLNIMGTSRATLIPALHYLYIRATGLPALLFMSASEGACLGQQDMWTPLKAVLAAGLINAAGDLILIVFFGLGTVGAGVATAIAHYAGALYFFLYLRRCGRDDENVQLKWKGLPTFQSVRPILLMGRFLVIRSLVLALTYDGMTTVATSMGDRIVAAHQVVLQCFLFTATAVEALSLTAQSLLARDQKDRHKSRRLSFVLLGFGAAMGTTMAALFGTTLLVFPQVFTYDSAVIATLKAAVPHGISCLILASISVTIEGICVGVGQIKHLPIVVFPSTGVTMAFLVVAWRLKLGLGGIWTAMVMFFTTRALVHLFFILRKWRDLPFRAPDPLDSTVRC